MSWRSSSAFRPNEPLRSGPHSTGSQHWRSFVRNHAQAIVACDFLVAVTARFQLLYIVVMEIGSRKIVQCNMTSHPTATWTMQQLREAVPSDHRYRFLIHDRDTIFSADVDRQAAALADGRLPASAPGDHRRPQPSEVTV